MSTFTYEPPEPKAFLYTLQRYLEAIGKEEVAALLINATCEFSNSGDFSRVRWDGLAASIRFHVPVASVAKFTDQIKQELIQAVDMVFPRDVGYDFFEYDISPILEAPPDEELGIANNASLVSKGMIEHDGLFFRSRTETRIYDALKRHNVLFFANATAVLGGKGVKREPDFLVCQNGKWGILEVMGDPYHPSNTAMRDHDRARLFKDYGLYYIEFYAADQCYNKPDEVVTDFLSRLSKV